MPLAPTSIVATLLRLALIQHEDWDSGLQQLLEAACNLLDVDRASYWSLAEDPPCLTCELGFVRNKGIFERGAILYERDCPQYFAEVKRVQVMVIDDTRTDPRTGCIEPYLTSHRVWALLDVPVFAQGRMVAVLRYERVDQRGYWTQHDCELALALSHALSSMLAARARNDAESGERQAAFLAQTAAALAAILDPKRAAEVVVRRTIPVLGDMAALMGYDGQRSWRIAHVHAEPEGQEILDEMCKFGADIDGIGFAVEALRHGQSLLMPTVDQATMHAFNLADAHMVLIERLQMHSVMSVLLRVRAEVTGVLTIASCTRTYDREDLRFAEAYADQVGTLMENTRLLAQTREALSARDDFVLLAGHELRTPLMALNSAVEIIKKGTPATPPLQRALDTITRQVTRLSRLTELLVAASPGAEGKRPLRLEVVDLAELVGDTVRDFEDLFKRQGCELHLSAGESVPLLGDRIGLEVVVANLLGNAMKFGANAPIEASVRMTGETATLVVTDHGVGIPAARLSVVFDRFERVASAQHYGGLGLGLYITSQIVEAHGGTIRVESGLGEGATFTVELPRRPAEVEPTARSAGGP